MPVPPQDVADAAERGLRWAREGLGGQGLTRVGLARGNALAKRQNLSNETIGRMRSFFARHGVNREGSYELQDGEPTPWRVAWDLWGGDAGRRWVRTLD
jgi:hypothetical protein